jgi:nucleoside-diphosphate-sugar epimerase
MDYNFNPSSRVLITGANGHVAQHVISQLLSRPAESRPLVRGTVRSDTSAAGLKQVFASHIDSGALELVFISDIAAQGAFDGAVKGCTHIAHIASPLVVGAQNVEQDVLVPAIRGTESVLASALARAAAVVVTSSFAACMDPALGRRAGYTYGPEDWNPISYAEAADPNLDLSVYPELYRPFVTYMASKKLAEQAAWDFYRTKKPEWRLAVVAPTYIGGPSVLPLTKGADSLSFSNGLIWKVATSTPRDKLTEVDFPCWVDVRDVATAHIEALLRPEAEGKRFILAPIKTTYAEMAGVLRRGLGLQTSEEVQDVEIFDIDDEGCEKVLGMKKWIGLEEMVLDTVEQVQHAEEFLKKGET